MDSFGQKIFFVDKNIILVNSYALMVPDIFPMVPGVCPMVLKRVHMMSYNVKKWHHMIRHHGVVQGSGQGIFPPRRFLPLHQLPGDDLT